jgi:hypothetical protein
MCEESTFEALIMGVRSPVIRFRRRRPGDFMSFHPGRRH